MKEKTVSMLSFRVSAHQLLGECLSIRSIHGLRNGSLTTLPCADESICLKFTCLPPELNRYKQPLKGFSNGVVILRLRVHSEPTPMGLHALKINFTAFKLLARLSQSHGDRKSPDPAHR
jgi:hypothetical protein